MTDPVQMLLSRLKGVRSHGDKHMALCPAHEDRNPSLSIGIGEDGRILMHCFGGCNNTDVLAKLGLTTAALMPAHTSDTDTTPRRTQRTGIVSERKICREFPTVQAAIAAIESELGPATCTWRYTDSTGAEVGLVGRWDVRGKKTFRPISRYGSSWRMVGMPTPRPLYRLPQIHASPMSEIIWNCEGEKAADACASLSLAATTSAHGSQSFAQTDWSPLAGRRVIILPDNDAAGDKYARSVAKCLAKLDPPAHVSIVKLPGLPAHGDIVEYIEERRALGETDAQIRDQLVGLAHEAKNSKPAQTGRSIRGWRPFPVQALPRVVHRFVMEHAVAMNCDPAFLAMPMLAMLAACIGMTRVARIKSSWREPCVIWTAVVTPSGTMKTPTMAAVLHHFRRAQKRELEVHQAKMEDFKEATLRFEKELAAWRKDDAGGDPPTKPEAPAAVRLLVSDTTVEALAPILLANPRGLLLERDELAGWIGDLDRYSKASGGDVARWLSAWSGEQIIIDRKGGGTIFVPHAAISVTGTIQPEVLSRVLGLALRQNGLAARLLMAMPPRRPAMWTDADVAGDVQTQLGDVVDRLLSLQCNVDAEGRHESVDVGLTPDARIAFIEWYNRHEQELAAETGDLAAALSKMRGYAARLALAFQLTKWASNDAPCDAIDRDSMLGALELIEWFKYEARRVYETLDESPQERKLRQRAETIDRKGGIVSVRDWQRSRSLKTSADALIELRELESAGFGTIAPAPQQGPGQPSLIFTLKRNIDPDTDNTLDTDAESPIVSVSGQAAGTDWGEL